MRKIYFICLISTIAALLGSTKAHSFTARAQASIEIIDRPAASLAQQVTAPTSSTITSGNINNKYGPTDNISLNNVTAYRGQNNKNIVIDSAYVILNRGNNLQFSAVSNNTNQDPAFQPIATSPIKQVNSDHETIVKLTTVAHLPKNLQSGKHNLAVQLLAIYE